MQIWKGRSAKDNYDVEGLALAYLTWKDLIDFENKRVARATNVAYELPLCKIFGSLDK